MHLRKPGTTQGKDTTFLTNFFFAKLLVVDLGPVSVEELVSVKDAHSARFVRYGIEMNIVTYLWF